MSQRCPRAISLYALIVAALTTTLAPFTSSAAFREPIQQSASAQAPVAKQVGVIKSIEGNAITLTTDTGASIAVQVAANAKMVRVTPGQTDLKTAPPIQLSDLHIGDRHPRPWPTFERREIVPSYRRDCNEPLGRGSQAAT